MAAQIVSGIGFLGAGLIITRRGAVQGQTTAAAIWESAAIGMATGAGLIFLTTVVTAILRQLLQTRALHDWQLMTLSGARIADATRVPASVDGVTKIDQLHDDSE